ncbi:hypothetical protein HU200_006168 [Digitaria exilis]|uniref:Uncharacterized protein n=1 Tax=Digitaria exilis TaxID=1010633 RepID=A0A835FPZ3_9POAL|nr:hypothetical protein HU200_006168 [Digitaria exilis]
MASPEALTNGVQLVPLDLASSSPFKAFSACLSVPDRSLSPPASSFPFGVQFGSAELRLTVVMRRLGCAVVGVLLLLGAALLSPVAVATARGGKQSLSTTLNSDFTVLRSRHGDEWRDRARAVGSLGNEPEEPAPPPPAAADGENVMGRRSDRRFRSRRIPGSQVQFGGRIPFTADYHSVHRHPPTHN